MVDGHPAGRRSWPSKFRDAFRGVARGVRYETSFLIHFFLAAAVVVVAAIVGATLVEWCLLLVCIFTVLTVELFNTAIERLAKVVHQGEHPEIRDCLDIASGAVLTASIGAAAVGVLILVPRALAFFLRLMES